MREKQHDRKHKLTRLKERLAEERLSREHEESAAARRRSGECAKRGARLCGVIQQALELWCGRELGEKRATGRDRGVHAPNVAREQCAVRAVRGRHVIVQQLANQRLIDAQRLVQVHQ